MHAEELILPSLQRIAYINATEHVQDFVAQRAKGVILHELSEEKLSMYQKLEALQVQKISHDIVAIFEWDVQPALKSYITGRYSDELRTFLETAEADIFWNIEITLYTDPTTREQCQGTERRIAGNRLASCGYSNGSDWYARAIFVYLEELMNSETFNDISVEEFSDAVLQVLLHEYLHAVSAKRHMTREEESANLRWVVLRDSISIDVDFCWKDLATDDDIYWEDLSTGFGFACNFLDTDGIRIVSGLESINEAITETIAAKAYSEYTRNKFWKPKRYAVSYMRECQAYSRTLKKFALEWKIPLLTLTKEIELGYLFSDERREKVMFDYILPMLEYYQMILRAQREGELA